MVITSNLFFLINILYIVKIFSIDGIKLDKTVNDLVSNLNNQNIFEVLKTINTILPYLLLFIFIAVILITNVKNCVVYLKKNRVK